MKKAMAKHLFRLIAAVFVLHGTLMLTATRADAQGVSDQMIGQSQNFNWVSETEAMAVLEPQLITLANTLAGLTPGTANYNNVNGHLVYYKMIYSDLEDGNGATMNAVNTNLYKVSDGLGLTTINLAPVNYLQLYTDAVGLLTN